MIAEKREKISLDIPPVVVFEGEEWNVGTIDHHENTVNIFRNTSIERKEYTYYDIETKTVNASELYKADTKCMVLKEIKESSEEVVYTEDLLNCLARNGIDTSKIKIEDCEDREVREIRFVNGSKLKMVETNEREVVRSKAFFTIM